MNFTSSQLIEISGALLVCFIGMLLCYRMPIRYFVGIIVVMMPFQFINTRFGSINIAIAFMFGFFLFIRKELAVVPVKWAVILLIFCVLLSFTQSHPAQNVSHMVYIGGFISSIVVFLIVYNFVVQEEDPHYFFRLLVIMNILVIGYSLLQLKAGGKSYVDLGGLKISIVPARGGGDNRLAGPFGVTMPGLYAEYLVLSNLVIAYLVTFAKNNRDKVLLLLLALCNLGCLVATGNRGGLIGIVLFFALFLVVMRKVLGVGNTVKIMVISPVLFAAAALFIINFTSYDQLFTRLGGTEIEGGLPDTRARTWPAAFEYFQKSPVFGHGPRLRLQDDKVIRYPDHEVIDFPHNLYLYLLCTVGIVGLSAYVIFWLSIIGAIGNGTRGTTGDAFMDNFPKFSLLLVAYILFDQIKIEYTRYDSVDYAHFMFAMFGLFLGMSERKQRLVEQNRLSQVSWHKNIEAEAP